MTPAHATAVKSIKNVVVNKGDLVGFTHPTKFISFPLSQAGMRPDQREEVPLGCVVIVLRSKTIFPPLGG